MAVCIDDLNTGITTASLRRGGARGCPRDSSRPSSSQPGHLAPLLEPLPLLADWLGATTVGAPADSASTSSSPSLARDTWRGQPCSSLGGRLRSTALGLGPSWFSCSDEHHRGGRGSVGRVDRSGVFFFDDLPPVPLSRAWEPSFGGHRSWGGGGVPCGSAGGGSVLPSPAGDSGELLNFIFVDC